jgi:carbamoyltransferase
VHMDLAAALRERNEAVMLHLAELARQVTGSTRLCLGGEVAQNCVAVGKVAAAGYSRRSSSPDDSGTALGAALPSRTGAGAT